MGKGRGQRSSSWLRLAAHAAGAGRGEGSKACCVIGRCRGGRACVCVRRDRQLPSTSGGTHPQQVQWPPSGLGSAQLASHCLYCSCRTWVPCPLNNPQPPHQPHPPALTATQPPQASTAATPQCQTLATSWQLWLFPTGTRLLPHSTAPPPPFPALVPADLQDVERAAHVTGSERHHCLQPPCPKLHPAGGPCGRPAGCRRHRVGVGAGGLGGGPNAWACGCRGPTP